MTTTVYVWSIGTLFSLLFLEEVASQSVWINHVIDAQSAVCTEGVMAGEVMLVRGVVNTTGSDPRDWPLKAVSLWVESDADSETQGDYLFLELCTIDLEVDDCTELTTGQCGHCYHWHHNLYHILFHVTSHPAYRGATFQIFWQGRSRSLYSDRVKVPDIQDSYEIQVMWHKALELTYAARASTVAVSNVSHRIQISEESFATSSNTSYEIRAGDYVVGGTNPNQTDFTVTSEQASNLFISDVVFDFKDFNCQRRVNLKCSSHGRRSMPTCYTPQITDTLTDTLADTLPDTPADTEITVSCHHTEVFTVLCHSDLHIFIQPRFKKVQTSEGDILNVAVCTWRFPKKESLAEGQGLMHLFMKFSVADGGCRTERYGSQGENTTDDSSRALKVTPQKVTHQKIILQNITSSTVNIVNAHIFIEFIAKDKNFLYRITELVIVISPISASVLVLIYLCAVNRKRRLKTHFCGRFLIEAPAQSV